MKESFANFFTKTKNVFLCGCSFFLVVLFVNLFLMNGFSLESMRWNGESGGIFPDLFETIKDSKYLRPYDGLSIYPPLVYLLCYPLTCFFNVDPILWDQTPYTYNWTAISTMPDGIIVGFLFFFILTAILWNFIVKDLDLNKFQALMLLFILALSPGYIFMIERGNILILTVLFIYLFVMLHDSSNAVYREVALVSLAFAASFKIYPAIFGILLLTKTRYKDAIRCIIYGILCFLVPFAFTGGIESVGKMISNIIHLSADYATNSRGFGYGYLVNVSNIINAFSEYFIGESSNSMFVLIITIVLMLMVVMICCLSKKRWMKIMALTIGIIILPSFSYIYTAVYLIVPLECFLLENPKINKNNILYTLLFILMFSPFPYGYIMESLPGANKMSYSTLIISISLVIFLIYMCVDVVRVKIRNLDEVN